MIIHAAGLAHRVAKNTIDEENFFKSNVLGTKNLLDGLGKSFIPKHFVFISSVSVYGLTEGINISEEAPLLAQDPYGLSKIEAELLIKKWCIENNVICTILRLPLLVGADPKGNLSSLIHSIKKGFYFQISNVNPQKSMILLRDVHCFIIKAYQIGGIYNLTDGFHPSIDELSLSIALHFKKRNLPKLPYWIAKCAALLGDIIGDKFPINSLKLKKLKSSLTFDDSRAREAIEWSSNSVVKNISQSLK